MRRIAVAPDEHGFVYAGTQQRFVPWGFNYDRDFQSRLIEDYWEIDWPSVDGDFREMKSLGANVVRVHLQFTKFMTSPSQVGYDELLAVWREADAIPEIEHAWLFDHLSHHVGLKIQPQRESSPVVLGLRLLILVTGRWAPP